MKIEIRDDCIVTVLHCTNALYLMNLNFILFACIFQNFIFLQKKRFLCVTLSQKKANKILYIKNPELFFQD